MALASCAPEPGKERGDEPGDNGDAAADSGDTAEAATDSGDTGVTDDAGDTGGTAVNRPPKGLSITIEPQAPSDDDDLTCVIVAEAVDPEGEPVTYEHQWSAGRFDYGEDPVLAASVTGPGVTFECQVTARDPIGYRMVATSSVTIAPSGPP